MNLKHVLFSILILAALSGCAGGGDSGTTTVPAATTQAPVATTQAPAVDTGSELHGVGTCDVCHVAPTKAEVVGKMATMFEKNPAHKDMCGNCHVIETHCASPDCHDLPVIMGGTWTSAGTADSGTDEELGS